MDVMEVIFFKIINGGYSWPGSAFQYGDSYGSMIVSVIDSLLPLPRFTLILKHNSALPIIRSGKILCD